MVVDDIKKELLAIIYMIGLNIKAAAALRSTFLLQIFGMMLNNIAFIVIWLFFSNAFGVINDWGPEEIIMLQGIVAFTFGTVFAIGNGARNLPEAVHNGVFDGFLLSPRVLYLRIVFSKIDISAIGDVFFGLLLITIASFSMGLSPTQVILLLCVLPASALIILNMSFLSSLVSFRIADAAEVQKNIFEIFFGPTLYPGGLFNSTLKFIFMFAVPSLFVGAVPVEIIRDMNFLGVALTWGVSIVWLMITIFMLNRSVKYYESTNLVGARVL